MNVEHSADLSLATGELDVAYTHASELEIEDTLETVMIIRIIDFAFTKDIDFETFLEEMYFTYMFLSRSITHSVNSLYATINRIYTSRYPLVATENC